MGEPEASLDQLPSNVPPRVKNALRRALQMDPAKRFPLDPRVHSGSARCHSRSKAQTQLVACRWPVARHAGRSLGPELASDAGRTAAPCKLSHCHPDRYFIEKETFLSPPGSTTSSSNAFELWAKPQRPHGIMLTVSGMFSIWSDNGQPTVGPKVSVMMNDRDSLIIHSPEPLTVETWHHLALVVHDSRIEFFQDGHRMNCDALMDTAAGTIALQVLPPISMKCIWPMLA